MTQANPHPGMTDAKIMQGAVLNGVINAAINGAIQLYMLWGRAPIPLSVDGITNDDPGQFAARRMTRRGLGRGLRISDVRRDQGKQGNDLVQLHRVSAQGPCIIHFGSRSIATKYGLKTHIG